MKAIENKMHAAQATSTPGEAFNTRLNGKL